MDNLPGKQLLPSGYPLTNTGVLAVVLGDDVISECALPVGFEDWLAWGWGKDKKMNCLGCGTRDLNPEVFANTRT